MTRPFLRIYNTHLYRSKVIYIYWKCRKPDHICERSTVLSAFSERNSIALFKSPSWAHGNSSIYIVLPRLYMLTFAFQYISWMTLCHLCNRFVDRFVERWCETFCKESNWFYRCRPVCKRRCRQTTRRSGRKSRRGSCPKSQSRIKLNLCSKKKKS